MLQRRLLVLACSSPGCGPGLAAAPAPVDCGAGAGDRRRRRGLEEGTSPAADVPGGVGSWKRVPARAPHSSAPCQCAPNSASAAIRCTLVLVPNCAGQDTASAKVDNNNLHAHQKHDVRHKGNCLAQTLRAINTSPKKYRNCSYTPPSALRTELTISAFMGASTNGTPGFAAAAAATSGCRSCSIFSSALSPISRRSTDARSGCSLGSPRNYIVTA